MKAETQCFQTVSFDPLCTMDGFPPIKKRGFVNMSGIQTLGVRQFSPARLT